MQLWPANENAFAASRVAASSRSASAATITGVAFPSSRFTRLRGARSRSVQPTPADPVNVISATRASSTRTSPISLAGPQTTLSQPAGRPASTSSSARSSADSGVCEAGFRTTAQPAARAGATLCATRLNGKLKGEIAPTTPIGIRSVSASLPTPAGDASIGTTSPASFRASTAAIVNVDCARAASTRAAFIGFPASSEIVRAISSARSSTSVRDPVEDRRALVRRDRRRHRPLRGLDRAPSLGRAAFRDATDERAVVRRADLEPVACLDPGAVDEELPLDRGRRHGVSVDATVRSPGALALCSETCQRPTSSTPFARPSGGGTARSPRSAPTSSPRRSSTASSGVSTSIRARSRTCRWAA